MKATTVADVTPAEVLPAPKAVYSKCSALVRSALAAFVLALALYQFSESTADPDLWGHVVFGQEMLRSHAIERTEQNSWTAAGQEFVNHEYGADLLLGGTHLLFGAPGIFLLKVLVGMGSFLICLWLGSSKARTETGASLLFAISPAAWVVGAVAVVEISFGFAARPQIFTALCLAIELVLIRAVHAGKLRLAVLLPVLFVFWINVHGGALAGVGLLGLAAGVTCVETVWRKRRNKSTESIISVALCFASVGVIAALLCNPWGFEMVRWLVKSVLWFRPEIEEWNPVQFNFEHLNFFILLGLTGFAWAFTRKQRKLWELAACAAFAVLALRSVRNTPLFGIVALALVPQHFADAAMRLESRVTGLLRLWRRPATQAFASALFLGGAIASFVFFFTLHKDHALTMEVPRRTYPVAAIKFMQQHSLNGNILTFFDWGDVTIFELPKSKVSIDGRLDAAYSRPLIKAHWQVYNGESFDPSVLPIENADFALLPSNLAGTAALARAPGWKVIYFDSTATLLARGAADTEGVSPIRGSIEDTTGRAAFPCKRPS